MQPAERLKYEALSKLHAHQRRVARARDVVEAALAQSGRAYVAFSGGKDSAAILHLACEAKPGIDSVFFDTGAELPDTYQFVERVRRTWPTTLHIRRLSKTIPELLQSYDAGTLTDEFMERLDRWDSDDAKTSNAVSSELGADCYFLGLRADESKARKVDATTHGPLHKMASGMVRCCPIMRWTAADVWAYIVANNLDYNAAYDRTSMRPREEIRVATYAGGVGYRYGRYSWLKREYPDIWRKLSSQFPVIGISS